jgi:hypothetical protein
MIGSEHAGFRQHIRESFWGYQEAQIRTLNTKQISESKFYGGGDQVGE